MESKENVIEYTEQLLAFEYQKASVVVDLSRPQAVNILQFVVDAKSVCDKKLLVIDGGETGLDASEQFEIIGHKLEEGIILADQRRQKKVSVLFNLSDVESLRGLVDSRAPELKEIKKRVGMNARGLIRRFEKTYAEQKQSKGEEVTDQ